MTAHLAEFAAQPIVQRLGWALVHSVWQLLLVAAMAAVALRWFRQANARVRYVGLCVALVAMAAAPVITLVALGKDMAWRNLDAPERVSSTQREPVSNPAGPFGPPLGTGATMAEDNAASTQPGVSSPLPAYGIAAPQPMSEATISNNSARAGAETVLSASTLRTHINAAIPWIVISWIAGVLLLGMWHAVGYVLASRLKTRHTRPIGEPVRDLFNNLRQRMRIRVPVRLLETTAMSVPVVIGWIRPVVLMPASVLSGLSTEQVAALLAHELAHVRRHDLLVNMVQTMVETCLFFHPAVWWLSKQIRIQREYCADDEAAIVCRDREAYTRALVTLAETVIAVPRPAVAASGGVLTQRIHRLLGLPTEMQSAPRRPAWLLSAVVGLALVVGLVGSTTSNARNREAAAQIRPIQELARELSSRHLHGWKLLNVDTRPAALADEYRGYRLFLRRTWKHYTDTPQQAQVGPIGPFELRHEDWELVLVPVDGGKAPAALKSQIRWQRSNSPYHTREVCLGEGHGYVWFTRATIDRQEYLRRQLKLEGGDERIELIIDGLSVEDTGSNTSNSCRPLLAHFGDGALPYLEKTIARTSGDQRLRVVGSLAYIRTPQATALLKKLANSEDQHLRNSAYYALIHLPIRQSARQTYIAMLGNHRYVHQVCEACVELDWQEALPVLRDLIRQPRNFREFEVATRTRRALEGSPVPEALLQAEQTLRKLMRPDLDPKARQQIADARALLINSKDAEAANLAALSLALFVTKGNNAPVNAAGLEILLSRPRRSTLDFLTALSSGIDEDQRPPIQRLLRKVEQARESRGLKRGG